MQHSSLGDAGEPTRGRALSDLLGLVLLVLRVMVSLGHSPTTIYNEVILLSSCVWLCEIYNPKLLSKRLNAQGDQQKGWR